MGDRVSGQHVLITTHDDPRHGELVDEFCDRGRHMLGVRLAVWTGTRVSELMQVGGRFGVHAQCPGNRLEDFGGGVSVAALLQALQLFAADAGQQGQLVAAQSRNPASRARHQSHLRGCGLCSPGPQIVAEVVGLAHAAKPKGGSPTTSLNTATRTVWRPDTIGVSRSADIGRRSRAGAD